MTRYLGLDIGSVRIGVALSDPLGMFAQGIAVLKASGDWISETVALIGRHGVSVVVIGLPLRTGGEEGPEAARVKEKARALAQACSNVDIVFWDERFSTVIAERALLEADFSRKKRRGKIDQTAAAVILQGFLDRKGGDLP